MPGITGACTITEQQVEKLFLAAPPLMAKAMNDLTIKHPVWLSEGGLYEMEQFPLGAGNSMVQLDFKGGRQGVERGFEGWKKLSNTTGCDPCEGDDCAYNWKVFPGHGIDRKTVELMSRDYRTPSFCVKEIQTTANFEEMFGKLVENMYAQLAFEKEVNIGQNYLTMLSKKIVVDSSGIRFNPGNPYIYPNIQDKRVSMLTVDIVEELYDWLCQMTGAVPYDVVDGAPIFALEASRQTIAGLYKNNTNIRQDLRFSGFANALVTKYNFMSSIYGMFLAAPIQTPRRFNVVNGEFVEVLPFLNGVPSEFGSHTEHNPDWHLATHEEVTFHGKWPFKVFYRDTVQTLGGNSSFGPEPAGFLENWQWANPQTYEDPGRRVGYYWTTATIGLSQQYSEALFGLMVERPTQRRLGSWLPAPTEPPTIAAAVNVIDTSGCPCPLIVSAMPNPLTAGNWFLTLSVPTTAEAENTLQLKLDTGGYVSGTVEGVSEDGLVVEVSFAEGTDLGTCDHFTHIFCDDSLGCSATVMQYKTNPTGSDATLIDLWLDRPIKAVTNGVTVKVFYGDGTSADVTVVAAGLDLTQNKWRVDVGGSAFSDAVGGIASICVPTATDATCPGCDGASYEACDSDAGVIT